MTAPRRILLGVVLRAHGLKGEVKVKSFTAEPEGLAAYGPVTTQTGRELRFERLRPGPGGLIARFEGVTSREAAEALAGAMLSVDRAQLPDPDEEGEYYHADLIGLRAEEMDGTALGQVVAVHDFGAGTVIEIEREGTASLLLPFTDAFVPEVDLDVGRMRVVLPTQVRP